MKKNQCTTVKLQKGEVDIYDFGNAKLHAYKTNDFLNDEVFIIEKSGKAVILEQPCFFDNIGELAGYITSLNVTVEGKLLAYHMAGGTFLPDVPVFSSQNAQEYSHTGGGKALIENFTGAFGEVFDCSISAVDNAIGAGELCLAGIRFNIILTPDAFNVEIPELGAVYTHMLGHGCHSIVAGAGHGDAIIAELNEYVSQGLALILNSHYTPEDLKDAETKIAYITDLKFTAAECRSSEDFKAAVQKKYPGYAGENYLDMTAGFFFPEK